LDKMGKSEVMNKVYSTYDEKYQIFAWILLFFLVVEFFVLDRKNRVMSRFSKGFWTTGSSIKNKNYELKSPSGDLEV